MDGSLAWAKCAGTWLGRQRRAVSPAFWFAQLRCEAICLDMRWESEAKLFEDAAAELESFAVHHGAQIPPHPSVFGKMDWASGSRLRDGDPLAHGILSATYTPKERNAISWTENSGRSHEADRYPKSQAYFDTLPQAWQAPCFKVECAKRTKATVKSAKSALPAAKASSLIQASRDLGEARAASLRSMPALDKLFACAKNGELGPSDILAVEVARMAADHLFALKSLLDAGSHVELSAAEARFAPQKAYAGFVVGKGFYGADKNLGVDLGAAKLFESEERALAYFKKMPGEHAVVELEIRVGAVKHWLGSERDPGLEAAAAQSEAAEMEQALDRAGVERLRARLAELEAQGAAAEPRAPKGRL